MRFTMVDSSDHPWVAGARAEALDLDDERMVWAFNTALTLGFMAQITATEEMKGQRFKRRTDRGWQSETAALFYLFQLPGCLTRAEVPAERTQEPMQRLVARLGTVVPGIEGMLDAPDHAGALMRAATLFSELCERHGYRKTPEPRMMVAEVAATVAGANAWLKTIEEAAVHPSCPVVIPEAVAAVVVSDRGEGADVEDLQLPPDTSPLLFLTGDALGFGGVQQRLVDLCVGFGSALSVFLSTDLHVPLETEDQKVVVAVGGYLAAAPFLARRWDINVFETDSAWQVRVVARHCGYSFDELLPLLTGDFGIGPLSQLAVAIRDCLAEHGVILAEAALLQLAIRLATSAAFIESSASELGVV